MGASFGDVVIEKKGMSSWLQATKIRANRTEILFVYFIKY